MQQNRELCKKEKIEITKMLKRQKKQQLLNNRKKLLNISFKRTKFCSDHEKEEEKEDK